MDPKLTILCVDDEDNQLLLRRLVLERVGYQVVTANSSKLALDMFEANPIDLAVVDYWMTGGNGLHLAGELKRRNRSLPVVILSAYTELPGETIGIADAWITKGASSAQLLGKLRELLEKAGKHVPEIPIRPSISV